LRCRGCFSEFLATQSPQTTGGAHATEGDSLVACPPPPSPPTSAAQPCELCPAATCNALTWVCVSLRRSYGARGRLGKPGMCPNPGGRVARSLARSLALAVLWAEAGGDGRHLPPILFNCYWGCRGDQIGVLCARADTRVRAAQAKRWTRGRSMAGGEAFCCCPAPMHPRQPCPPPPALCGRADQL
jgi:hypothetical protein